MKFSHAWVIASVAALAACGGGGGSSDGGQTPAPAPGPITVTGTAATGAALASAAVTVKCAAGAGTATTGSDGAYTVTIASASLPCALQAVGSGKTFHSVLPSGAGPYTAHLTPLTDMLVAKLAAATPASFFSSFGSSSAVSAASVTQAIDYLKLALAPATNLSGVNPLTDALVVGNPLDLKLDALMTALASAGLTVEKVNAAIVANPTTPAAVASSIAPVASDCAWFKSGKYRMINPYETDPKWRAHVLSIDVVAKTATDQDGVVQNLTSSGACQYSVDETDFTNTVMVSSSGVLVVYSQSKTTANLRGAAIGLPEQTLPLAEFAGTWNVADWELAGATKASGYLPIAGELTFDATGHMTAAAACSGLTACVTDPGPYSALASNAAGGFDIVDGGAVTGRAFMFKNSAANAVVVAVFDDGSFSVGTRKQSLGALPVVGTVSPFHEFSWNGNGSFSTLVDHVITVNAIDAVANSATRTREDGRVDTIGYDKPRIGLRYRALNSCTNGGVASNCSEVVQMPLQGMGITLALSVGTNTATSFFDVAIAKP